METQMTETPAFWGWQLKKNLFSANFQIFNNLVGKKFTRIQSRKTELASWQLPMDTDLNIFLILLITLSE